MGRFIGAMSGGIAAFAGVFAIAYSVTGGSIWMLAFFPAMFAAPAVVIWKVLSPVFEED